MPLEHAKIFIVPAAAHVGRGGHQPAVDIGALMNGVSRGRQLSC